jgi:hypothetical protein
MIIVTGSVHARPEALDEVLRLSLEHVHRSRLEPGCLLHFAVPESRAFARALGQLSTDPQPIGIYDASPAVM